MCECGDYLHPDPFTVEGEIWVAYVCRRCGVQHIVKPFKE